MTTFALGAFINAVIDTFTNARELKDVTIFDGPQVTGDYPEKAIAVGHDGLDFGEVTGATSQNSYKPIGPAHHMDEVGLLDCTIYANIGDSGDDAFRTCRGIAFDILSRVDTVIRADPTFGNVIQRAGLSQTSLKYDATGQGTGVKIVFSISYKART